MRSLSDYEVLSVLGCGSSGTCFKVRNKQSSEIFAWKAVDYVVWEESLLAEFELLLELEHPNIVRHLDYVLNKETQTVYIVMEYCEGGDLSQLIEQCKCHSVFLLEDFIWRVLYQICRALQMCHNKFASGSVLHRDIKPANVFLDGNGNVKVGDFGLAKILRSERPFAESFVGTPYYMSPEIMKGKKYSRKSDVWSLGCLVYEMCALKPPFGGRWMEQLSQNITRGNFRRIPDCYSDDLQNMIAFMLDVSNDSRPSVDVVLRHPILAGHVPSGDIPFPPFVNLPSHGMKFSPVPDFASTALPNELNSLSTPALRSALFGSIHRKLFSTSDPDLSSVTVGSHLDQDTVHHKTIEPSAVTQNIFNEALADRLHAIRVRESLIKQKEAELDAREKELNERAKRIAAKEKSLEELLKRKCSVRRSKKPSKKPTYDDIDSSLAPNDTITPPTVAKLDLATMKRPKAMQKVIFQSPKKYVQYNIENVPPDPGNTQTFRTSTSSKTSDDSDKVRRLKSVLSFFGGHRAPKVQGKTMETSRSEVEPEAIASKWTNENKKAAFKILAEMNEAGRQQSVNRGSNRRSLIVRRTPAGDFQL